MSESKRRAAEIAEGIFKGKSAEKRTPSQRAWKFKNPNAHTTREMGKMLRGEVETVVDMYALLVNPKKEIRR